MAYYEDIIFEKGQVKCNLCSIIIEDDDAIIEHHVNGTTHKELEVKKLLLQHSVIVINKNIDNNTFYCQICDLKLGENVKAHLQSHNHNELLKDIRRLVKDDGSFLELPESLNDKEVYCVLCDNYLAFKILLLSDHIKSARHRRARAVAIQPFNGIFSVEGDNKHLWCKFCQRYIENYIEVIISHIDSVDHVIKLAKIINLIKDDNISIEKYLLDPKEDKARCMKCQMDVSCNVMNLESHIKGKIHSKS